MDEPLSNLDAKLRVHMRAELTELHRRLNTTFIYVTHDQVEAMTMADRVAMMDAGRILQLGTPTELYARPANVKVAQFIGSPAINLFPVRIGPVGVAELHGLPIGIRTGLQPGAAATVGLRPEALQVCRDDAVHDASSLQARVRRIENLGAECMLHFDLPGNADIPVVARAASAGGLAEGDQVVLGFDPAHAHLFDATGDRAPPPQPAAAPAHLQQAAVR